MTKVCGRCGLAKDIDDFSFKNKLLDKRQTWCKPCHKEYRDAHYVTYKQKYIDKAAVWRRSAKVEFLTWIKTKSCLDCGNRDFRVLEFDHLYDKKFNISSKIGVVSLESLFEEINKCEIVCANCHRIRTADRGNYYNYS